MDVSADVNRCVPAGVCVSIAPHVFDQRDDGKVVVSDSHPSRPLHSAVREAGECCPSMAITVRNDGQQTTENC